MKKGDVIIFTKPVGNMERIVAEVERAPTASGPFQPGSLAVVRDAHGQPHIFDAWVVDWELLYEAPDAPHKN
jgi:hypothetical protein